ncbi:hypothetical protein TNCT_136941 [Trichonephila clavata]|uniref:Uncharacterized protein n=1 Tax=Trichonephila clavata TaxID=2740835 RepID=A0A8X6GB88_TRICU|nr:hypothetical protein TNCT_136941 [Trichonephila clavata]
MLVHFRSDNSYGLGGHRGLCGGNGVGSHLPPRQRTHGLEDIPQVRASKSSKVSKPVEFKIHLQDEAAPPESKKVSPFPNLTSLQENATPPQPQKVSAPLEP